MCDNQMLMKTCQPIPEGTPPIAGHELEPAEYEETVDLLGERPQLVQRLPRARCADQVVEEAARHVEAAGDEVSRHAGAGSRPVPGRVPEVGQGCVRRAGKGEELVGAKQNRILNTTIVVPKGASLDVPMPAYEVLLTDFLARRDSGETDLLFGPYLAEQLVHRAEELRR